MSVLISLHIVSMLQEYQKKKENGSLVLQDWQRCLLAKSSVRVPVKSSDQQIFKKKIFYVHLDSNQLEWTIHFLCSASLEAGF